MHKNIKMYALWTNVLSERLLKIVLFELKWCRIWHVQSSSTSADERLLNV